MKEHIEKRVLKVAVYILATNDTVRGTAKVFKVCKSTIHKDITSRLPIIDSNLAKEVRQKVIEKNLSERHMRGGIATSLKYKNIENRGGDQCENY